MRVMLFLGVMIEAANTIVSVVQCVVAMDGRHR